MLFWFSQWPFPCNSASLPLSDPAQLLSIGLLCRGRPVWTWMARMAAVWSRRWSPICSPLPRKHFFKISNPSKTFSTPTAFSKVESAWVMPFPAQKTQFSIALEFFPIPIFHKHQRVALFGPFRIFPQVAVKTTGQVVLALSKPHSKAERSQRLLQSFPPLSGRLSTRIWLKTAKWPGAGRNWRDEASGD